MAAAISTRGNLIDVAQRDHDARDDFGGRHVRCGVAMTLAARGDEDLVVVKQVAKDDGLVDDGATHGYLLPRDPKPNRRFLWLGIQSRHCAPRSGDWGPHML